MGWWFYGFLLRLIALIHALAIRKPSELMPIHVAYETPLRDESVSKTEQIQITPPVEKDDSAEIAYFETRDVVSITCPVCQKVQQPNRDSCFSCGCHFEYGVPLSEQENTVTLGAENKDVTVTLPESVTPENELKKKL